jgi:hypothetical protein
VEVSEESGCDGSLAIRRVVYVVNGFQQGRNGREEPGAVFEV